jgi:hypothetical protein
MFGGGTDDRLSGGAKEVDDPGNQGSFRADDGEIGFQGIGCGENTLW